MYMYVMEHRCAGKVDGLWFGGPFCMFFLPLPPNLSTGGKYEKNA